MRGSLLAGGLFLTVVQLLAVLLMLWARVTFGRRSFHAGADPTEGGLVTTGPYKFLRHPIYAAILYFIWSGILTHLSVMNLLLGVVVIVGAGLRMFAEEKLLLVRYPEYIEYATRTKRIIPFVY